MPTRRIEVEIVGDAAQLERAFGRAALAGQKFERQLQTQGQRMTRSITVPLLAGGAASVKLAQDFDLVISRMVGLAGVSEKQAQSWRKNILELAPKVGKAPKELAEAMYQVASSGVPASKALDVLRASAKASAAGMGDTAVVADALTSVINAYGAENITAAKATDIFVQAVKDGKGEAADFAPVIGRVVAVAAPLGISFDQVAAALARMTQFGVPADEAATQLGATMSELLKVTPKAEKALNAVGLSSEQLRQEVREKGLLAALEDLNERFDGNTVAMSKAFPNVRALRGVLQLLGGDAGATAKIFGDTKESTGALGKAFGAVADEDAFKMQQALADLKSSAIEMGEELAPLVRDLADDLRDIAGAYRDLTPAQKELVTHLAEAAAVSGPLVLFAGKAIAVGKAIKGIGTAATVAAGTTEAAGLGLLISRLGILSKIGPIAITIDLLRGKDSLVWKIVSATFNAGETAARYAYGDKSLGARLFPGDKQPNAGPQPSLQEKFRGYLSNPNLTFRMRGNDVVVTNSQGNVFHTFRQPGPAAGGLDAAFYAAAEARAQREPAAQVSAAQQTATHFAGNSAYGGSSKTAAIVKTAIALGPASGKVYVRGGGRAGGPQTVQTAYDCSGYLYDVYRKNGITIPQTAASQFYDPNAIAVALDELQPGDGVYFDNGSSDPQPGHAGIVVSGHGRSAVMIDYFRTGQKAENKRVVDKGLPFAGGRRWVKVKQDKRGPASKPTQPAAPPHDATDDLTATQKKPTIVTGLSLLTVGAQTAITKADRTKGTTDDIAAYERALAELRAKLKKTSGEQRLEVEKEITDIQGRIDSIKTTRYQAQMDKIVAATRKAIDDAKQVVQQKRSAFEGAFQTLAGKALDAFDAETRRKLDQLQVTVSGSGFASFLFGGDISKTPTEQKIAQLQAERARAQRQAAVDAARSDLEKAKAEGDPAAIKQAQQALDDAEFDQRLADLQTQADAERAAADRQLDDAKTALEQQRAAERDSFQARLADLQTYLDDRHTSIKTANDKILDLFRQFGVDLASIPGLASALGATLNADQDLQSAESVPELGGAGGSLIRKLRKDDPVFGNAFQRLVKGEIPGFATGGVVPGPIGEPTIAVVHGGEEVLTYAQRQSRPVQLTINVAGSVVSEDELTLTVWRGLQRIADRSPEDVDLFRTR